jgi:Xaa-Pro aminopeptidase
MSLAPKALLSARQRRARGLMRRSGVDTLIVTHPPNIRYLTNFAATAGIAVLTGDSLHLIVDFRYYEAADALWASPSGSDGSVIRAEISPENALAELVRNGSFGRVAVEGAHLPLSRALSLARSLSTTIDGAGRLVCPEPAAGEGADAPERGTSAGGGRGGGLTRPIAATEGLIEAVRAVKDAHEIALLRSAARLLSSVARDVLRSVTPGRSERDLAADIDGRLLKAGFERPAFETIVASGPNSAMPHARPGDRRLTAGDLVVLDFGGVYSGYCVDLTRTLSLGEADQKAKMVYNAVLGAQAAAIRAVQPGVKASQIDFAARDTLRGHDLADAFGHGTGHGLGVEVHESPRIGPPRESIADDTIEPGMVFTVEPGAYVPGWGGVRIEDDVLVTESGCEVLTAVPVGLTVE